MRMFAYPKQAEFNRVVPKSKIYAHAKPEAGQGTVRGAGRRDRLEVQALAGNDQPSGPARHQRDSGVRDRAQDAGTRRGVLQAIDKPSRFHSSFELTYGDHVRFAASYKRPSEADSSKWVIEASFQTEPQPRMPSVRRCRSRSTSPVSTSRSFAATFRCLRDAGESLAEHVARFSDRGEEAGTTATGGPARTGKAIQPQSGAERRVAFGLARTRTI